VAALVAVMLRVAAQNPEGRHRLLSVSKVVVSFEQVDGISLPQSNRRRSDHHESIKVCAHVARLPGVSPRSSSNR